MTPRKPCGRLAAHWAHVLRPHMLSTLILTALALAPVAEASLSEAKTGPWLEAHGGLGLGGAPGLRAGLGWHAGGGWWFGPYDDVHAVGRYVGLGVVGRQDFVGAPRTAGMLELRRGMDLIIAGVQGSVAGGVVTESGALGWTGRAAFTGRFRRHRFWSLSLRLEAGADGIANTITPTGGVLLGVAFSRPASEVER